MKVTQTDRHNPQEDGCTPKQLRVPAPLNTMASAELVNRTHRVVRERAGGLISRKTKMRSMYIPLAVSAGLLTIIIFAVWSLLDQYETSPTGLPDASQQILVLLMWCLPVTAAMLTVVWFRKGISNSGRRDTR